MAAPLFLENAFQNISPIDTFFLAFPVDLFLVVRKTSNRTDWKDSLLIKDILWHTWILGPWERETGVFSAHSYASCTQQKDLLSSRRRNYRFFNNGSREKGNRNKSIVAGLSTSRNFYCIASRFSLEHYWLRCQNFFGVRHIRNITPQKKIFIFAIWQIPSQKVFSTNIILYSLFKGIHDQYRIISFHPFPNFWIISLEIQHNEQIHPAFIFVFPPK